MVVVEEKYVSRGEVRQFPLGKTAPGRLPVQYSTAARAHLIDAFLDWNHFATISQNYDIAANYGKSGYDSS
jgi:hypothetical protein